MESEVGSTPVALMYFAAAAGGGAASYIFGPELQVAVGASGAIFGLFGAWLFVAYRLRRSPAGRAMFNQLIGLLLINLALPLFVPNIDWRAHLGGLVTGVVIAALWGQFAAGRSNARVIRSVIAGAILVGLLALIAVV
jgi:membrane associated rhomboid family serine protease